MIIWDPLSNYFYHFTHFFLIHYVLYRKKCVTYHFSFDIGIRCIIFMKYTVVGHYWGSHCCELLYYYTDSKCAQACASNLLSFIFLSTFILFSNKNAYVIFIRYFFYFSVAHLLRKIILITLESKCLRRF